MDQLSDLHDKLFFFSRLTVCHYLQPDSECLSFFSPLQILKQYGTEWIVSITDVTPFVRHQHRVLKQKGQFEVSMPFERVYTPPSQSTCQRIELDYFETSQAEVVS